MRTIVLLTSNQLEILKALNEPLTVKGISFMTKISEAHVYHTVKPMVKSGLLKANKKSDNINYADVMFYERTEKGSKLKEVFENDH